MEAELVQNLSKVFIQDLEERQVRWRKTNPLFQCFPWYSGAVLDARYNSLSELLRTHSKSGDSLADHLLVLALTLDANETERVYEDDKKAQSLFQVLDLVSISGRNYSNHDGNYFSSVIFGYKLFDTLLERAGTSYPSSRVFSPRLKYPAGISSKFQEKIIDKLHNWPEVVKEAFLLQKHRSCLNISACEFLPTEPTISQRQFACRLEGMMRASARVGMKKADNIILNLESAVVMIQWILAGNLDMPMSLKECVYTLVNSAKILQMNIAEEWLENKMRHIQPADLRNPLHYALAISPLVLLLPINISKQSLSRETLVKICASLGNDRPLELCKVENLLWDLIFRVVQGASLESEIDNVMNEHMEILYGLTSCEDFEPGWFSVNYVPRTAKSNASSEENSNAQVRPVSLANEVLEHNGERKMTEESNGREVVVADEEIEMDIEMDVDTRPSRQASKRKRELDEEEEEGQVANGVRDGGEENLEGNWGKEGKGKELSEIRRSVRISSLSPSCSTTAPIRRTLPSRNIRKPVPALQVISVQPSSSKVSRPRKVPRLAQNKSSGKVKGKEVMEVINITTEPQPPSNLGEVPSPKRARTGPCLRMYGIREDEEPMVHTFKTYEELVEYDHSLVQDAQKIVGEYFVNGRPRHHQPSARNPDFDPEDVNGSCVFICTHREFEKMSTQEIQKIFRKRHIIVTDVPGSEWQVDFTKQGLKKLGPLHMSREMQVQSLRTKDEPMQCLRYATFAELLDEAEKGDDGHILNALSIPFAGSSYVPPKFGDLATDVMAWQATLSRTGLVNSDHPSNVAIWSIAATRNAYTGCHIDTDGFCTTVTQATGLKYWLLSSHIGQEKNPRGNMRSIHGLGPDYSPSTSGRDHFQWEGILLKPGTTLYMRPNTVHFAVTIEKSIMLGRHFMCSTTALDTCSAIIHCFVVSHITNATHMNTSRRMLRRMFAYWMSSFETGGGEYSAEEHTPDLTDREQFMDVLAVCNTLALSEFLDYRYYQDALPERERVEQETGRRMREEFIGYFCQKYILRNSNNEEVDPISYIFNYSLARVAACIYRYKKLQGDDFEESTEEVDLMDSHNISPDSVHQALDDYLACSGPHPDLSNCYENMVGADDLEFPFEFYETFHIKKRIISVLNIHSETLESPIMDVLDSLEWREPPEIEDPARIHREVESVDVDLLRSPTGKLNDVCINVCAKILSNSVKSPARNNVATFLTYLGVLKSSQAVWRASSSQEFWSKPIWVIPTHVSSQGHWVVFVAYLETKELHLFDSSCIVSQNSWEAILKGVLQLLAELVDIVKSKGYSCPVSFKEEWTAKKLLSHPVQRNGYDCGVWILLQMFAVMRGFHLTGIAASEVPKFRRHLLASVLTLS